MKLTTTTKFLLSFLILGGYLSFIAGISLGYFKFGYYWAELDYFIYLSISTILLFFSLLVFRRKKEIFISVLVVFSGILFYSFSQANIVNPNKIRKKKEQLEQERKRVYQLEKIKADSLHKVIIKNPEDYLALSELARTMHKTNRNPSNVISLYNRAILHGDNSIQTKKELAMIYRMNYKKKEARQVYEQILLETPNDSIIINTIRILNKEIEKKELKEKYEMYDRIVLKGDTYFKANNLEQARIEYQKAIDIDEHGKSARVGITKIVIRRCNQNHKSYCQEIKKHLDYLKKMDYLTQAEATDLLSLSSL